MARNQTLVQLSDELLAALDEEANRLGSSRSHVIRTAIEIHLASSIARSIDDAIVAGYTRQPQQVDVWMSTSARSAIADEPW